MPLAGSAFLALWNDHADPDGDYAVWHTREHVAERLGVPGFLCARRYVAGGAPLPSCFTLYALADLAVLDGEAYRRLLAHPSAWSQRMRPGMRNFLRRGCRTVASFGAGIGGLAAAGLFRLGVDEGEAGRALARIAARAPFCAAHLGRIDPRVAGVAFAVAEPEIAGDADMVLIFEGYEDATFAPALAGAADDLAAWGVAAAPPVLATYRLAFALDREARAHMLPLPDGERQG